MRRNHASAQRKGNFPVASLYSLITRSTACSGCSALKPRPTSSCSIRPNQYPTASSIPEKTSWAIILIKSELVDALANVLSLVRIRNSAGKRGLCVKGRRSPHFAGPPSLLIGRELTAAPTALVLYSACAPACAAGVGQ